MCAGQNNLIHKLHRRPPRPDRPDDGVQRQIYLDLTISPPPTVLCQRNRLLRDPATTHDHGTAAAATGRSPTASSHHGQPRRRRRTNQHTPSGRTTPDTQQTSWQGGGSCTMHSRRWAQLSLHAGGGAGTSLHRPTVAKEHHSGPARHFDFWCGDRKSFLNGIIETKKAFPELWKDTPRNEAYYFARAHHELPGIFAISKVGPLSSWWAACGRPGARPAGSAGFGFGRCDVAMRMSEHGDEGHD